MASKQNGSVMSLPLVTLVSTHYTHMLISRSCEISRFHDHWSKITGEPPSSDYPVCVRRFDRGRNIELFKKSVRGTLQGAIRVDISIERLVAGLTGKDPTMSVEEFFKSNTRVADTVTKHYGSLFINCRERPLCFYAQWSIHCRMAYRLCLQKSFLSPYYTGGEVGGSPDVEVMDALQAAHDSMDKTVSGMRAQMTLRSEEEAMVNFRATMKNAEKFKRYLARARLVISRRTKTKILPRRPSSRRSGSGLRLTRLAWWFHRTRPWIPGPR